MKAMMSELTDLLQDFDEEKTDALGFCFTLQNILRKSDFGEALKMLKSQQHSEKYMAMSLHICSDKTVNKEIIDFLVKRVEHNAINEMEEISFLIYFANTRKYNWIQAMLREVKRTRKRIEGNLWMDVFQKIKQDPETRDAMFDTLSDELSFSQTAILHDLYWADGISNMTIKKLCSNYLASKQKAAQSFIDDAGRMKKWQVFLRLVHHKFFDKRRLEYILGINFKHSSVLLDEEIWPMIASVIFDEERLVKGYQKYCKGKLKLPVSLFSHFFEKLDWASVMIPGYFSDDISYREQIFNKIKPSIIVEPHREFIPMEVKKEETLCISLEEQKKSELKRKSPGIRSKKVKRRNPFRKAFSSSNGNTSSSTKSKPVPSEGEVKSYDIKKTRAPSHLTPGCSINMVECCLLRTERLPKLEDRLQYFMDYHKNGLSDEELVPIMHHVPVNYFSTKVNGRCFQNFTSDSDDRSILKPTLAYLCAFRLLDNDWKKMDSVPTIPGYDPPKILIDNMLKKTLEPRIKLLIDEAVATLQTGDIDISEELLWAAHVLDKDIYARYLGEKSAFLNLGFRASLIGCDNSIPKLSKLIMVLKRQLQMIEEQDPMMQMALFMLKNLINQRLKDATGTLEGIKKGKKYVSTEFEGMKSTKDLFSGMAKNMAKSALSAADTFFKQMFTMDDEKVVEDIVTQVCQSLENSEFNAGMKALENSFASDKPKAIRLFSKLSKLEDFANYCYNAAKVKEREYVIQIADYALQIFHNNAERCIFHLIKAKAHRQLRDFPKAFEDSKECLKINSKSHDAHFEIGMCYLLSGEKKKAKSAFNKCLELSPGHKNSLAALKKLKKMK